ncbi:uncharacterized protein SOCE26_082890 [Sorangium cellulosum]|uniref:Secreted protein n=1 Tax=Sorangium cellulosum TaxID=56 RepID=A0A2L0F5D9_SORCE|nr:hypothetical protein [Sorangium cellulosum]AUX46780.1 uncharacterized protein SOCE26_082890 [Sorangium cellulosum]
MIFRHFSKLSLIATISAVGASFMGACTAGPPSDDLAGDGDLELTQEGQEALACSPIPNISLERSLIVTDAAALAKFPLDTVLDHLLSTASAGPSALELYQRWWDSQNDTAGAVFPDAIHCDADGSTINGFPVQCPRNEGSLASSDPFDSAATNPDFMKPVAIVNRFDLAPLDGAHCGEYRIIYAKRSSGVLDRNLIILEAQLPNPNPECGIAACRPVAEFWANLTSTNNAVDRANALETFYYDGIPGFAPALHPDHFAEGAGQIRTNQFMSGPNDQIWQLREFKLEKAYDGPGGAARLFFKPTTVKENPFGELFNVNFSDSRTASFQTDFISRVEPLIPAGSNVNQIVMKTPELFNAGQSNSQGTENEYAFHLNAGGANNTFIQAINAEVASMSPPPPLPVSAVQVADRATTQSCGGCHQTSSGDYLGGFHTWPQHLSAFSFVHVDENSVLSKPLVETFLPHRKNVLQSYLQSTTCDACTSSVTASASSSEGIAGTLGGSTTH